MRFRTLAFTTLGACVILVAGCGGSSATTTPTPVPLATAADGNGNYPGIPLVSGPLQKTASGLGYLDLKAGTGPAVQDGQQVSFTWTGWFVNGLAGTMVSFTMGEQKSTFVAGRRQVIPALEEAVKTMKVGGKRRVVAPPELGYGANGLQNPTGFLVLVPPNVTLVIDLEVTGAGEPATPATSGTSKPGA